MHLTWLGTAGFIVKGSEGEIVFDPFLSRGEGVESPFTIRAFENAHSLFVGHGHFDHTYDVPDIVQGSDLQVYAPGLTGRILRLRGVPASRLLIADNKEYLNKAYKVRAFKSSHVKFDWPLVVSTLKRCKVGGCLHMLPRGIGYPKGLVQTYLFEVQGKTVLFISSAGCTEDELKKYRQLEVDFLLAPLQGHSQIQSLVAQHVMIIQPKVIIPHHHDNFYPPLSQNISVDIFREELKVRGFRGDVLEIPLFESVSI